MTRTLLALLCVLLSASTSASAADVPALVGVDTTWTAAGGPWVLAQDVTVAEDATLSIEPGALVLLDRAVTLSIAGALVARGTAAEPILFQGLPNAQQQPARWGSVVFLDSSEDAAFEDLDEYVSGSIIEGCTFEGGTRAVIIQQASPYVHESTFRDNACCEDDPDGGAGLWVQWGSAPRIQGCTFEGNVANGTSWGGGLLIQRAHAIVQDNVFVGNESVYGAGLCTDSTYAPIVGNRFEENDSGFEGGGLTLYSSSPAFLNNEVLNNSALSDGGVHVCVTCRPHASPFFMDNTITGNESVALGAAGVGLAYVRAFRDNNVHDNLQGLFPVDFGWFQEHLDVWPDWILHPDISRNWWGTTDPGRIASTILDGADDEAFGTVTWDPPLDGPVTAPQTRVTITTMKLVYKSDLQVMPVYLTIYNPGPAREVDLAVLLQMGDGPRFFHRGELAFPGAVQTEDGWRLTLPENSVWFEELMKPSYDTAADPLDHGFWHAALTEPGSGGLIGDLSTIRFELGPGGEEPEEER